jgi:transcriptional regulator with XRE-family HTH domain
MKKRDQNPTGDEPHLIESEKIRQLRKAQKKSRADLATEIGVSYATVIRWERDKCSPRAACREPLNKLIKTTRFQKGVPHEKA